MSHSMIDEYFKIYSESIKEYGEKTCVLYACGSFYEIYSIDNPKEQIGNAKRISEIIKCEFSNKNKTKRSEIGSTRAFPDFCGFGIAYLHKHLTSLLDQNYTIVVVDQDNTGEKRGKLVKRNITAIHSPCLKPPDFETSFDTEYSLISIFLEVIPQNKYIDTNTLIYSVCSLNNVTNTIEINEDCIQFKFNEFQLTLDEINRILLRYNVKQMKVFLLENKNLYDNLQKNVGDGSVDDGIFFTSIIKQLTKYIDNCNYNYKFEIIDEQSKKYSEYTKTNFQNEYFNRVYKHLSFGLLSPLEYLNLLDKSLSIVNLMYILDFMSLHNPKYLTNLSIPNVIKDSNNLVLELNTLSQLSLLPNTTSESINSRFTCVFDVINHTNTAIGRRHLKNILSKPFKDIFTIEKRYNLTEELNNLDFTFIDKTLLRILDFERLHRKMDLSGLHPYEFPKLNHSYMSILELISFLYNSKNKYSLPTLLNEIPKQNILYEFNQYIEDYKKTFNLDMMKGISLNTSKDEIKNFFNNGVVVDLDKIQSDIESLENDLETLRVKYDTIINDKKSNQMIKLNFTDNDGYYFVCTKIRYQKLIKECKDTNFTMRATSNTCKFTTDEITKISNKLITTRELFVKKVKLNYLLKISEYSSKYKLVFSNLKTFIEIIDISLSNLKCSKKYRYCKPVITEFINETEDSSIEAESLRHPIIELITDTEYIPNDISLNNDKVGILLYGLNSSGKSSLLRALGISIILAQCGLYVPCKSFKFSPFSTIISQVDLTDNLFNGKSSFITEMCGLKKILSCASKNTLVLSDELCRGTEVISSSAIVSTTILKLIELNTKFFFTTHLHDLPKIQSIKTLNTIGKIEICHLNVNTNGDNIIFERNLLPGSGSELYGLEVCRSIIQDNLFIETAFEIRNDISGDKTSILNTKRSRYNKQKIVDSCEVCGYTPTKNALPLDTHHINEQKNCDKGGFVNDKHFHKNRVFNLVSLCKACHLKIDTGELQIKGYKKSISGKYLDY